MDYTSEELGLLERMSKDGPAFMTYVFNQARKLDKIGPSTISPEHFKLHVLKDNSFRYGPSSRTLEEVVYKLPIKDMPLLINDFFFGQISKWRLKLGR